MSAASDPSARQGGPAAQRVADLESAMARIAPPWLAESWDNVGLIVGSPEDELRGPVVLTIDLTEPVARDAVARGASALVSYHPPVFDAVKRLTGTSARGRAMLAVLRAGIAVYSPHTALDAAHEGMTDWLADGLLDSSSGASGDRRALAPAARREPTQQVKIVTFVPQAALDAVRDALASAGAGIIGAYQRCSFTIEGQGSFFGGEFAKPSVGEVGRLERVSEFRLEMVCSERALGLALQTLRQFHPYEEPAIDVYTLARQPDRSAGAGRRLMLDTPTPVGVLLERMGAHLGVGKTPAFRLAPPIGAAGGGTTVATAPLERQVSRIGVCPGAGDSLAPIAIEEGCELYVTGEMKHHAVLACVEAGVGVLLLGHTRSERGYLPTLARRLATELGLPAEGVLVSPADAEIQHAF